MTGALDALRPFVWLALIAFLVGFVGYLALARPSPAAAREEARPASLSGPVSAAWNIPKRI